MAASAAVFLALVCSLPQVLPLLKTFLLGLSFGVCGGCGGVAVPVGGLCCILCALDCNLVSYDLCMPWYPPDVNPDIASSLKDMVGLLMTWVTGCCPAAGLGVMRLRMAAWLSTKIQMVFVQYLCCSDP